MITVLYYFGVVGVDSVLFRNYFRKSMLWKPNTTKADDVSGERWIQDGLCHIDRRD